MKKTVFIIGTSEKLTRHEIEQWSKDLERYLGKVKIANLCWLRQQIPTGALLCELECGRVSFLTLRKKLSEASNGKVMVWKAPGE